MRDDEFLHDYVLPAFSALGLMLDFAESMLVHVVFCYLVFWAFVASWSVLYMLFVEPLDLAHFLPSILLVFSANNTQQ